MKGCESCKGNVAPGKKCWACGLEGPAEPAKCTCDGLDVCTTCYMTMANTGKVFRSEPEPAKPPEAGPESARSILEKAICDVQDIAAGPFGPGMLTMDSALDLIRKITSPLVDSFAGKPISEDDRVNFARWLLDDTDFHVTNFDAGRNYK